MLHFYFFVIGIGINAKNFIGIFLYADYEFSVVERLKLTLGQP